MPATGYYLFQTAIGACAIAWRDGPVVVGTALPDADDRRLRARMGELHPAATLSAPPDRLAGVVADVVALIDGETPDFAAAPLDMGVVGAFEGKVYAIARTISPGQTRTYGEVARELGDVALSRAAGQALGRNPWPIIVPCHRVLASSGKTGGFSAPGGVNTKFRLLEIERRHAQGDDLFAGQGGLAFAPRRTD